MYKGGRPKAPIWGNFITLENKRAQCKKCQYVRSAKVERLTAHHARCSSGGEAAAAPPEKETCAKSLGHKASDNPCPQTLPPPMKKRKAGVSDFFVGTSRDQKQDIDQIWADLLFATNTPFNFVEHPLFNTVCNLMRPGYTPPSAKQVGGELLDNTHKLLQARMKSELEGKMVTIL